MCVQSLAADGCLTTIQLVFFRYLSYNLLFFSIPFVIWLQYWQIEAAFDKFVHFKPIVLEQKHLTVGISPGGKSGSSPLTNSRRDMITATKIKCSPRPTKKHRPLLHGDSNSIQEVE